MINFSTLSVKDLYNQWIHPLDVNQDIFEGRLPFSYACINGEDIAFLAHHNELIVGLAVIHQNEYFDEVWHNLFVSVDTNWQGQGIGNQLLEYEFKYVSFHGGYLVNSPYSLDGKTKMQKYYSLLADKYNIQFLEAA